MSSARFHELCGRGASKQPLPKEFSQAKALIDRHGPDKALYAVEYAVKRAQNRFGEPPEVFGGVLNYVHQALGDFANTQTRAEETAQKQAREDIEEAYNSYHREQIERARANTSKHELAELEQEGLDRALKDAPSASYTHKTLARLHVDQVLTSRMGLPTLDEWKSRRNRASDNQSAA